MDSVQVKSNHNQIKNVLRGHFEAIRRITAFSRSTIVFIPENNLGNEASHMVNMIKNMKNVKTYWSESDRPGINKTHNVTDDYQFYFDNKLKMNMLDFEHNFFTTSPGKTIKQIKGQAQEQLSRYHIEYQDARDNYGRPKQVITGKMGAGMQDDLAIAILMAVYWGRVIIRDLKKLH